MANNDSLTTAEQLAREELIDMVPYQSARRLFASADQVAGEEKIWLNANEAPGLGDYQISANNINRYPDFQPDSLISAYSDYAGLSKTQVLATRGADEGIELIIRTFCKAYQDSILICPPTYGMYAISAENHGAGIVKVPLKQNDLTLDLDGLAEQVGKVNVVFLCSPGNPTGNLLPEEQIAAAIELFKDSAMVVVDEAYIEFSPDKTSTQLLSDYDNVIILRTLSKAFALAGLRCGFTLANQEVITLLSKVIAPYPISAPVAEIASQALTTKRQLMTDRVSDTNRLREELSQWLQTQRWCEQVFTSNANFVLFRCSSNETKTTIFELLVANNILIRDQSKQQQLSCCLRISIGNEQEIAKLQQVLTEQLSIPDERQ
ncbi:histidinol-phosphate transaminase [Colwellia sp. RSH04]|uniref:histidinol-phosphate transaminase n=1 Tax=Colwellia sp. RSH04 TaxID=2305464 RepID=UPI000E58D509|nr:histidinol-phosphate transaminase [Colwellia sp. RSH04]RHW74855.1 histidinol-phosphate transaminase [Colwellia sp. RSH04]